MMLQSPLGHNACAFIRRVYFVDVQQAGVEVGPEVS